MDKLCKDCKHHREICTTSLTLQLCKRPVGGHDPVTGEPLRLNYKNDAYAQRRVYKPKGFWEFPSVFDGVENGCGPEGKYFETREVKDV